MFKTNASLRRYLANQLNSIDAPTSLKARYRIYVECVGFTEYPKTFKQWLVD
jgi:hypothetical protein